MIIVKVQNSCVFSNGIPTSFDLKIQQLGVISPSLLKLNITSSENSTTNALEIGYIHNTNEDHKYIEKKTVVNLDKLALTASTNNIKSLLTDLEELKGLFKTDKSLQKSKTNSHEIKIKQKEFKEFIFEYKTIDLTIQDQEELTGMKVSVSRGLVVKNNQSTNLNTESVKVSLKVLSLSDLQHTNDFSEREQRDFPLLELTKIFAKVSNNDLQKRKKNYFQKQTLKVNGNA